MIDWKKQARKWQRAFHALEDELHHGKKIGCRVAPKKPRKAAKKKPAKRKAPAKDLFDFL